MRVKQSFIQHPYEWLSTILLFVFFFPLVFIPNQALFLIHDNLDSNVVWYKCLAESGLMFGTGNAIVDFTMGGIPRDCLPTEWNVERLLYYFFNAQLAYTFNYMLIHIIAFVGMRLLIKRHISQIPSIYNLVAIAFALLPFWPSGGLTVAGLPLLLFALLTIFKNNARVSDWLICILFPFYSSLPFGNMFSIPLIFVFYLFLIGVKKWKFKFVHLLPFTLLTVFSIISEYRLFRLVLQGFESNRLADIANVYSFMNIKGIIGSSAFATFLSHYHFHSISLFIAVVSIVTIVFYISTKKPTKEIVNAIILIVCLSVFSFVMIFLNNTDVKALFGSWFPRFNIRLWVVFPIIWYIVFAFITQAIRNRNIKLSNTILFIQVFFVLFLVYPKDYFGGRYAENVFANTLIYKHNESQKWKEYYRVEEFDLLKKQMPEITDQYVVRIGIIPEILQYNGLKTLEGYYSFYPIEKFNLINQIDNEERAKSSAKQTRFSNRNYLYIHTEISSQPNWDYKLLNSHSVGYIVSDKKIKETNWTEKYNSANIFVYNLNKDND